MLYDGAKQCGKIFECLKYRQRKVREQKRAAMDDEDMSPTNIDNSVLNVEIEELKEFFAKCILPRDIKEIEAKMADTVDIRREMLQSSESVVPKVFDFYWIDTQLVIFRIFIRNTLKMIHLYYTLVYKMNV